MECTKCKSHKSHYFGINDNSVTMRCADCSSTEEYSVAGITDYRTHIQEIRTLCEAAIHLIGDSGDHTTEEEGDLDAIHAAKDKLETLLERL